MATGDARDRVSLGKRRSVVLKDHFGPQMVLYSLISYPSLKRANEKSPGNSGRAG